MTAPRFLHRTCPLCGSGMAQEEVHSQQRAEQLTLERLQPFWSGLFKEKPFFTYRRCEQCELLYNPTYFSAAQLSTLYAQMASNMEVVSSEAIAATQRGYFDQAAAQGALAGGYLEIGPDVGHIVGEAARRGAFGHFWLFEPNRAIHARLRAATGGQPATLLSDMTDLSAVPDGSVGLAVMIHVLDHLLDPAGMLRQIRAKLLPGGTLMIVTHNEASLLRRLMGTRWPPFCLQHPELYNPTTMRRLLEATGYTGTSVERSVNWFPLDFLAKQAAWSVGLKLNRVPLPALPVGLRLGNIITFARAPDQAAARSDRLEDVAA